MSRELAEVVWARYKEDGTDLKTTISYVVQHTFSQKSDKDHTNGAPDKMDDRKDNRDFEGTVSAKNMATSGICSKLQEVQRVCENGDKAASRAKVEVVELAREVVEQKRKNATLPGRSLHMEAELVEAHAARSTMRDKLEAMEGYVRALKTQLVDA